MTESPITRAHRTIRSIAPPDTPVAGALTTCGSSMRLVVDEKLVDASLWRATEAEHVWAPADIIATPAGTVVAMPWCTHRFDDVLASRAHEPCTGGELVTIAISLLRGATEAIRAWSDEAGDIHGRWWLSEDGRPLFVRGEGEPLRQGTARILHNVSERCADALVVAGVVRVAEHIVSPQLIHGLSGLEESLFALCAPREIRPVAADTVAPGEGDALQPMPGRFAWRENVREAQETTIGARLSAAFVGLRDRVQHLLSRQGEEHPVDKPRARRGVLAAGVGVMAFVVVAGIWVFSLPESEQAQATPAPSPSQSIPPQMPKQEGRSESSGASAETTVQMATRLISMARACAASGEPCTEVVSDPQLLARIPSVGEVALVDDYGGMAVVSVGDPAIYVVLEKLNERWRIRDVPTPAPS